MTPMANFVGRRFGRLTVLFQATEWRPKAKTLWACLCDCGRHTIVRHDSIRAGHTRSCGCLKVEQRFKFRESYVGEMSVEWNALLDTLESVITRFPQPPRMIRNALESVWGGCQERRFWRALRMLVSQGRIVRGGNPQSSEDDIGSVYTRSVRWHYNLGNCVADAAACVAVYELGYRRAA